MESVSFRELTKRYGPVEALKGISLDIEEGELFGIIGPDGAGKTSLFRILTSLILPDGGNAQVCGMDVVKDYRRIRRCIGYMPGRFSLYQDLTVAENLAFFATLFGTTVKENYNLVRDIYRQLEPFATRRAGKLSGGMKQKLALCCALIHRPKVLFLDEPTTGVDAVSRQEFWQMLDDIQHQGITIVASTPYMDEAARCGRIALINQGTFLRIDTPQAIAAAYPYALWAVRTNHMHRLLNDLRQYGEVKSAFSFGDNVHTTFRHELNPEELRAFLQQSGHADIEIARIEPGVEDCFILWGGKEAEKTAESTEIHAVKSK